MKIKKAIEELLDYVEHLDDKVEGSSILDEITTEIHNVANRNGIKTK